MAGDSGLNDDPVLPGVELKGAVFPGEIHELGEGLRPPAVVELPGVLRLFDEGEEPGSVDDVLVDVGGGVAEPERPHTVGEALDRGVDSHLGTLVALVCVELVDMDGDEQARAYGAELRHVDLEGRVLAVTLTRFHTAHHGVLALTRAREGERRGCVAAVEQRAELQRCFAVRRVHLTVELHGERPINSEV